MEDVLAQLQREVTARDTHTEIESAAAGRETW
jgi:hypothetical protein